MTKLSFRQIAVTLSALALVPALLPSAFAQQSYTLSNSPATLLYADQSGTLLNNETPSTPGNLQGQLVQLGYFDQATDTSLFAGVFRVLAQFLSGDSATGLVPIPDGRISLTAQFATGGQVTNFPGGAATSTYTAPSAYPVAGTPLAIRWYATETTASVYNSMSAQTWDWITPTGIPSTSVVLNPDASSDPAPIGLAFEDPTHPFQATLSSVPEPSAVGTLLLVMVAAAFRPASRKVTAFSRHCFGRRR